MATSQPPSAGALDRYLNWLDEKPVVANSVTTAICASLSELVSHFLAGDAGATDKNKNPDEDERTALARKLQGGRDHEGRTRRAAIVKVLLNMRKQAILGFFVRGPIFVAWNNFVNRVVGIGSDTASVIKKTAMTELIYDPLFCYGYISLLRFLDVCATTSRYTRAGETADGGSSGGLAGGGPSTSNMSTGSHAASWTKEQASMSETSEQAVQLDDAEVAALQAQGGGGQPTTTKSPGKSAGGALAGGGGWGWSKIGMGVTVKEPDAASQDPPSSGQQLASKYGGGKRDGKLARKVFDVADGAPVGKKIPLLKWLLRNLQYSLSETWKRDFKAAITLSWKVWPLVTLITFRFVPKRMQVAFQMLVAVFVNAYMTSRARKGD